MLHHRGWFLIMALLLAIGLPAAVSAGGWSVVTLDSPPGDLVAGSETTIGFTVLQHGVTPVLDERPDITLTNMTTGEKVMAVAYPEGRPGHYAAKFALTQPGTWTWEIRAFDGPHAMPPLTVVAAAAPAPQAPIGQAPGLNVPVAQAPGVSAPVAQVPAVAVTLAPAPGVDWLAVGGAAALAIVLGLVIAAGLRGRRPSRQVAR